MFLLVIPFLVSAQENQLKDIKLIPQDDLKTTLSLISQEAPDFEIVENLKLKILIVKLRNTRSDKLSSVINFKDPLINGVRIQSISKKEHWLKIRTKYPDLKYSVLPRKKDSNLLQIQFSREIREDDILTGPELVNILRELNPKYEKLILQFDKPVKYDIIRDTQAPNNPIQVRFLNTRVEDDLILPDVKTKIIKKIKIEKKGKYQVLVVTPTKFDLIIKESLKKKPFQLTLHLTEDKDRIVAKTAKQMKLEKKKFEALKEQDLEKTRFITSKFEEAERDYKRSNYSSAALQFKNIFNFAPNHELGIRANFRSADSLFQQYQRSRIPEDHDFVIQSYKSAINSALVADLGFEDIPRAYYQIGKSHLKLEYFEDALNQFEIILENYPASVYSKDSLFQKGKIHLNMQRYERAIEDLDKFIEENSHAPQVPEAYYKKGESQFQLKQYKDAKASFDRAWSLDPDLMKNDAELMFHMGEAYYENEDYQTARSIYEILIDRYKNKKFSNLVAIRIGDFLRAEDKEDDAIKAYEKAIVEYSKELLLIGKLRIASIYSEKPEKGMHQKALEIYDFIIDRYPLSDQVQEAMLRKSLTLSLFQYYDKAVTNLEGFCEKYPDDIYVKNRIIQNRIIETINDHIRDYYFQHKYLDALGVFEKYEKKYYLMPQNSACYIRNEALEFGEKVKPLYDKAPIFVIADSFYRLGLHDKAIDIFDIILKDPQNPHAPLALMNKGRIMDIKNNPEAAQELYAHFIKSYPNHSFTPTAKRSLGNSYYKVQRPDRVERAIRIYNQTIRDYQDSENNLEREIIPSCWFALGNLYQEIGQYDNSINAYKKALSSYEHPLQDEEVENFIVDTHFILGNLYFELNQIPEAMETYNTAISHFPNSEKTPWAKYQKGQIFIKNNQKEKALKIFEELVFASKSYPDALWGPMAKESLNAMVNDLNFKKYLQRTPTATVNNGI